MIACRKSFTDTLLELARQDKDIVAVTTDARGSVTLGDFAKELPAQFVECGIAEQDAVGISAGLAHSGKKVFVCGPACFYVARSLEQVKVDLAYSQNNVKILGVSGGVAYGALGATHHSLHDIAVLRTFPGMNIVLPCDARQTRKLVKLWPALLNDKWQSKTSVVNASISGDTSQQGLARLPALLKQHQPRWVLVELGGNDGLRGFQPQQTEQTLRQILQDVKAANAEPLLMQIRLPANYGRRYNEAFSAIYPKLAKEFDVPLLPFFMEEVYLKPQWMQDDGIHPNHDAQPFIADWMAKQLQPLVNHDS